MARNRSEKLPRCPEAHAWANDVEAELTGDIPRRDLNLWGAIPVKVRASLNAVDMSGTWQERCIRVMAYIRENYAP